MDDKTKYFFISASGTKMMDISASLGNDDQDEIEKLIGKATGKPEINKIPVSATQTMVIKSPTGMFVPAAIESTIKNQYGLDSASIVFVREMTKEEFDFNQSVIEEMSKPKPLKYNVKEEIEDMIGRISTGDLKVVNDLRPDFASSEEEKDLLDLGLPMNLFDESGLWEDSEDKGEE
jgi:hypothetical protein